MGSGFRAGAVLGAHRVRLQPDSAHLEGGLGSEAWDEGGEKGHHGKVQRQIPQTRKIANGHTNQCTPHKAG